MLTDDDIKKLKKVFATKAEFFEIKTEMRLMEQRIDKNLEKWKSEIFNLFDGLAVEIKDGRESRSIFSYRIEDLDKRVKKVEEKISLVS